MLLDLPICGAQGCALLGLGRGRLLGISRSEGVSMVSYEVLEPRKRGGIYHSEADCTSSCAGLTLHEEPWDGKADYHHN